MEVKKSTIVVANVRRSVRTQASYGPLRLIVLQARGGYQPVANRLTDPGHGATTRAECPSNEGWSAHHPPHPPCRCLPELAGKGKEEEGRKRD